MFSVSHFIMIMFKHALREAKIHLYPTLLQHTYTHVTQHIDKTSCFCCTNYVFILHLRGPQ